MTTLVIRNISAVAMPQTINSISEDLVRKSLLDAIEIIEFAKHKTGGWFNITGLFSKV